MSKYYEVTPFIPAEPEEQERYETQRDAMSEVKHLSTMQPENNYVVEEVENGERRVTIAVIEGNIFLPM